MESSIAEFLSRKLACKLLPTCTAGVGCKNEINLGRGSNTQKGSAWPTDVPSFLGDRPPEQLLGGQTSQAPSQVPSVA